jgi:hypothetical protein
MLRSAVIAVYAVALNGPSPVIVRKSLPSAQARDDISWLPRTSAVTLLIS